MSVPRTQRSAKELFAWPAAGPSKCSGRRVAALATMYPLAGRTSSAGAVNPALQQVDFYIRNPDANDAIIPAARSSTISLRWRPRGASVVQTHPEFERLLSRG